MKRNSSGQPMSIIVPTDAKWLYHTKIHPLLKMKFLQTQTLWYVIFHYWIYDIL